MANKTIDFEKRNKNLKLIKEIYQNPEKYLVIHYSCESFISDTQASPRITSIAIRNLESAQTQLFSIYKIAEIKKIASDEITKHYDELEKELLRSFYEYLQNKSEYKFIHWNMRDLNYGFQAIEHRYKILGGTPPINIVGDDRKIDLARVLVALYGINYINHPRMENLITLNNITNINFLTGAQEAEAFNSGNYLDLQRSTLRKVDCMCNILDRINGGYLKTHTSLKDIYFSSVPAVINLIKEHFIFSLITIIVTSVGMWNIIMWVINLISNFFKH